LTPHALPAIDAVSGLIFVKASKTVDSYRVRTVRVRIGDGCMCCVNTSGGLIKLFTRAILYADFRARFLADPLAVAKELGLGAQDLAELAKYDARKLRATVEGPEPQLASVQG
jgi:hypothetical protein